MTRLELMTRMMDITDAVDFLIIFSNECHPDNWGEYYPNHKVIVIFTLDEEGNKLSDREIIKTSCHEMAHHLQFHHLEDYEVVKNEDHDEVFKKVFAKLLHKYYNGNIPKRTLEEIKEEGLLYESDSKEKKRGKPPAKRAR